LRIFICGIDGYLGWAFACRMKRMSHEVIGMDNESRRRMVWEVGSNTGLPIGEPNERAMALGIEIKSGDMVDRFRISTLIREFEPEVIIQLAQIPSAPYSMVGPHHAFKVQHNNVLGTLNLLYAIHEICPDAHLIKLGTLGEYGIPDIDITEGDIEIEHNGRKDKLPFPCQPLSFYHASKVHDSVNIRLACKIWGLRCTDVMQGVVYGTSTEDTQKVGHTRFDFDEHFGTVINRFCAQAVIGHPLTVYGGGNHKRGLLPLQDSMQCLDIICHNTPEQGEYRVVNQFEQYLSMNELARIVKGNATNFGMVCDIKHIENPRVESDNHHYNPERTKLIEMGYAPTMNIDAVITKMIDDDD